MFLENSEITVIGGGIVGLSVAFGLLKAGHSVAVIEGLDTDFSASRGNFGLVWMQGKGSGYAPYAHWTRDAVAAWPSFSEQLHQITGDELSLNQTGGFEFFTEASEFDAFGDTLREQHVHLGNRFSFELLDGDQVRRLIPGLGPNVAGASFCELDGHVNPLKLLSMLKSSVVALGGTIVSGANVTHIEKAPGAGFQLSINHSKTVQSNRIILCAGLGSSTLAEQVGFKTQVAPQRGELLITEKLGERLPFLSSTIRQVNEGGIQIGGTQADAGYNDDESLSAIAQLAKHAVDVFPALADLRVIRSWGALRVMSPDGYPVYSQSQTHPGAYLVSCHSGVTLASLHATALIDWIDDTPNAPDLEAFDEHRFSVQSSAQH